jgi:chorismate mutase
MPAETTTAETPSAGTTDAALGRLRNLLAVNDRALLDLVNRRLDLVHQIKQRKAELGIAFLDPEREARLLQYLRRANNGRLSDEGLRKLLTTVLALTKLELAGQ